MRNLTLQQVDSFSCLSSLNRNLRRGNTRVLETRFWEIPSHSRRRSLNNSSLHTVIISRQLLWISMTYKLTSAFPSARAPPEYVFILQVCISLSARCPRGWLIELITLGSYRADLRFITSWSVSRDAKGEKEKKRHAVRTKLTRVLSDRGRIIVGLNGTKGMREENKRKDKETTNNKWNESNFSAKFPHYHYWKLN